MVTVEETGLRPPGSQAPHSRVLVMTPDSVEIRMLLPPPVPDVGDGIPLVVEVHRRSSEDYSLDGQAWRIEGPPIPSMRRCS